MRSLEPCRGRRMRCGVDHIRAGGRDAVVFREINGFESVSRLLRCKMRGAGMDSVLDPFRISQNLLMDRIRRMSAITGFVGKRFFTFGVCVTSMQQFGPRAMARLRFIE